MISLNGSHRPTPPVTIRAEAAARGWGLTGETYVTMKNTYWLTNHPKGWALGYSYTEHKYITCQVGK